MKQGSNKEKAPEKEVVRPRDIRMIDGKLIESDLDRKEYLDQICCVFEFLGDATQAMRSTAEEYAITPDADFGHYLVFGMAINKLKEYGELVGTVEGAKTEMRKGGSL